jgi:hypothetical protein
LSYYENWTENAAKIARNSYVYVWHLVDTTLSGCGNGTDVEGDLILAGSLTGITGWCGDGGGGVFVVVGVVVVVGVIGCSTALLVEGEGVGQTLLVTTTLAFNWGEGDQAHQDG